MGIAVMTARTTDFDSTSRLRTATDFDSANWFQPTLGLESARDLHAGTAIAATTRVAAAAGIASTAATLAVVTITPDRFDTAEHWPTLSTALPVVVAAVVAWLAGLRRITDPWIDVYFAASPAMEHQRTTAPCHAEAC